MKARDRSVVLDIEDGSGFATLLSTVFVTDAKAFHQRLDLYAATVCPADPRTVAQRRADAHGAIGRGADRLVCLCGSDGCPAAQNPPAAGTVVYVIASEGTLADAAPESERPAPTPETPAPPAHSQPDERAALDGEQPRLSDKPLRDLTLTEALAPPAGYFSTLRPAAMMGGQFLPGASLPGRHRSHDHAHRAPRASTTGEPVPTVDEARRLRPLPRYDVSLPGLPRACHPDRHRPHDPVAARPDRGVQPEMRVPSPPFVEDLLGR